MIQQYTRNCKFVQKITEFHDSGIPVNRLHSTKDLDRVSELESVRYTSEREVKHLKKHDRSEFQKKQRKPEIQI